MTKRPLNIFLGNKKMTEIASSMEVIKSEILNRCSGLNDHNDLMVSGDEDQRMLLEGEG